MGTRLLYYWSVYLLVGLLASAQKLNIGSTERNPVIFVPDLLGSILQVEISHQQVDTVHCPRDGSYSLYLGMPVPAGSPHNFTETCMYKLTALDVDPDSGPLGVFQNKRGVTVWLPDTPMPNCLAPAYHTLGLPNVFADAGYIAGEDVRYFCYDWRLAPDTPAAGSSDDKSPAKQLEQMIKDMARESGRKVWLVGHSYGCTIALATVLGMQQRQAEEYVAGIIMVTPLLSGSPLLSFHLFSGVSLSTRQQFPEAAAVWQSWPALYTLLPTPDTYQDMVVLVTDMESDTGYTVSQLDELFADSHMDIARKLWRKLTGRYAPCAVQPPVPVHAFTVYGVDTAVGGEVHGLHTGQSVKWSEYMDGDGVVDEVCSGDLLRWQKTADSKFHVTEVNSDHQKALPVVLPQVLRVVNQGLDAHNELR